MTVSLGDLRRAWDRFFFEPVSPLPVAVYRILHGCLVLAAVAMLWPDADIWYTQTGVLPRALAKELLAERRLNLFGLVPDTAAGARVFLALLALAAAALTAGFKTRASAAAVFIGLASLHHRNHFILHSGDTFLRVMTFFLICSEAGSVVSVDHWLRLRRGQATADPPLLAPWGQRLLQLQMTTLYFFTFLAKASGTKWVDGTALYYILNLDEFHRFPISWLSDYLPLVKAATWGSLAVELALATLIWIKELRYPVLVAGIALHLGIEWSMNVPLFQWALLAAYVNFVDPDDLVKWAAWARARLSRLSPPVTG